jgi:DNA gyrase subunit B
LSLTRLYSCREAKRNRISQSLCGVGIIVTNALSEWLRVETVQDGWLWHQQYSRGHAEHAIEKQKPCTEQWQQITFRPDPEIFGTAQLSADDFKQWFKQQHLDLGAALVTLHYKKTSERLFGQQSEKS